MKKACNLRTHTLHHYEVNSQLNATVPDAHH